MCCEIWPVELLWSLPWGHNEQPKSEHTISSLQRKSGGEGAASDVMCVFLPHTHTEACAYSMFMFILSDDFDIFPLFMFWHFQWELSFPYTCLQRFCSSGENTALDVGREPGLRSKGGSCTYLKSGTQCVRIQSHMMVNECKFNYPHACSTLLS